MVVTRSLCWRYMYREREFLYMLHRICIEISDIVFGRNRPTAGQEALIQAWAWSPHLKGEATPGTCVNGASLWTFGSTKSSKGLRHPGASNLSQLPYYYIRPSAKLAVKPANWWLRSNLNGSPGRIIRATRSPLRGRPSGVQRRCGAVLAAAPLVLRFAPDRRR